MFISLESLLLQFNVLFHAQNLPAFANALDGLYEHHQGYVHGISRQSLSHFSRILCVIDCPKNCLHTEAVHLAFFNESLMLEGLICGYIYQTAPIKKLGSDEN